jgi:hypothetical protein
MLGAGGVGSLINVVVLLIHCCCAAGTALAFMAMVSGRVTP